MKRSCIIIMSIAVMVIIFCITPASADLVNLATDYGTATQSSTYYSPSNQTSYPAQNAIDENLNTYSATNSEYNAWWQVDLGNLYSISKIEIYNRSGFFGRINPSTVSIIANGSPIWNGSINTSESSYVWNFSEPKVGQIVKVQLLDKTDYLNMIEVYVKGDSAPVPIPPSVWLLGAGLVGLAGLRRRFRR